ncbi:SDR family NAD(P)-dependent oxidoreductase [Paenibacillus sp. PAMC21692]|uniref:SDR family NAD(P)-dependent oxidoreductase n=1 Tax=Paenibacillus sp. PAMC21692 TaxID=2762320 RepID=UPI00164D3693|nr:SDR family oxidoreductase [Paenibacillus sp. PAMC21692]QNK55044.1 SDR family oxidoreductase [Paenibacillus sp. PAMC21692]
MLANNKVCLITGGGSGIGEVTAIRLAEEGATVIVADMDGESGERVAQAIAGKTGRSPAVSIRTDVADEGEVRHLAGTIRDRYGRLDVLINNAATILPKPLEDVKETEWQRVIDINMKSVYLLIKHTIPLLRESKGSIVNMASLNGLVGQKQNAVYASTKGAIVAMTKSLALDYASDGVRVNCICPAGVSTPLLEKWIEEQDDPAKTRIILNDMHPLGRPATPEEVADAAIFFASDLSRFVTGVALPVDGGASLGY